MPKAMTRTIDNEGYERRTKRYGTLRCKCGKRVELTCETEEWTKVSLAKSRIKWRHAMYGFPTGFCECGFAYAGTFDGIVRLDCRSKQPPTSKIKP